MSCADLAFVPAGGRRSTKSRLGYASRYVQFEAPPEYCVTLGSPSRPETIPLSQVSTARTSISSPGLTAPDASSIGSPLRVTTLGQLDARNDPLVDLVRSVSEPEGPRLCVERG